MVIVDCVTPEFYPAQAPCQVRGLVTNVIMSPVASFGFYMTALNISLV